MKKLSVLLVAAAVALSASAGIQFKSTHSVKTNKMVNKEMVKANISKDKASFRVINTQPEGELKSYNRAGQYDYNNNGYLYCGQQDGNRMDIVYAEDGKVYMKNILCGSGSSFGDYWVEGTIEGNEIHVALGQEIYYSDYYSASVLLAWGEAGIDADGNIYFIRDERAEEAVYAIDGETITLLGSEGSTGGDYNVEEDYHGIGLTAYWEDDDSWTGYLEWNTVLTEREPVVTPTVITEIPEGCEVTTYYRSTGYIAMSIFGVSNGMTDGKLIVAIDPATNDAYVQNPSWWHDSYNSWVKGTFDPETGIITIPTGQYLTWYESSEYGIVLGWGSTYVYEDTDESGELGYYLGYELDERTTEIQIQLMDGNIYMLGSEGNLNAEFPEWGFATGMMTYYSDDLSMTSIEFANNGEPMGYTVDLKPAVPANATADEWYDCGDETGFSRFYFTLPTTDVDGNKLDPEYISYALWINDGAGNTYQYTFPAAVYTYDLTEDIDEVTYDIYSNAVDFKNYYVYMYRTNMNDNPLFVRDEEHNGNIGIQVFYTVDGVKNASEDIAWLYEVPSSVNEMNAGKTVANVRYFNVAGQEMAQPNGMTIKVTTYTDGTTSATKVVK
jgi:hypothetical protein